MTTGYATERTADMIGGGGPLPDKGKWASTKEAARVLARLSGHPVSVETLRRWCREGSYALDGVDVWHIGDRYYIEMGSLLDHYEKHARHALEVVAAERKKLESEKRPPA